MDKTTIETMKSVIQDWMAECETPEQLYAVRYELLQEIDNQCWALIFERAYEGQNG